MEVRELRKDEILPALHLIWEVFIEDVAPFYMPEGIEEFQKSIKYETVLPMYENKEITMFGAFDEGILAGTISVKSIGHIFMFYVRRSSQGKGVGRMLFQAVYHHCVYRLGVRRITVNAAPDAVPKYIHMGMHVMMPEQIVNGIRYTPMEMYVNQDGMSSGRAEKNDGRIVLIIIGVVAAVLLCFMVVFVITNRVFKVIDERNRQRNYYREYHEDFFDDYMEIDDKIRREQISL